MSRRGFTLLELLVAVAILAIVMATVYGVLARALFAKNHGEERAELYADGREAVLKIADDLEGALPPNLTGTVWFIGAPGTERVPSDTVEFWAVVRRPVGPAQNRGGRAVISYALDPIKDTPNLFALRRQEELPAQAGPASDSTDGMDNPDNADAAPPQPVVIPTYILDQVAGLRLRYLDPQSGEWVTAWDTTAERKPGDPLPTLPGAVEVTLFLADSNGGVHDFSTIVDLPLVNLSPTPRQG